MLAQIGQVMLSSDILTAHLQRASEIRQMANEVILSWVIQAIVDMPSEATYITLNLNV